MSWLKKAWAWLSAHLTALFGILAGLGAAVAAVFGVMYFSERRKRVAAESMEQAAGSRGKAELSEETAKVRAAKSAAAEKQAQELATQAAEIEAETRRRQEAAASDDAQKVADDLTKLGY